MYRNPLGLNLAFKDREVQIHLQVLVDTNQGHGTVALALDPAVTSEVVQIHSQVIGFCWNNIHVSTSTDDVFQ